MKHTNRSLLLFILLAGVTLILRIGYNLTLENEVPLRADAGKYFLLATNLTNHGVYSLDLTPPLSTSTLITPGYPLFLSGILLINGDPDTAYLYILLLQALISTATAILAFCIAKHCLQHTWAPWLAFVLVAFYPHQITSSGLILTESLFGLLLASAIFASIKGVSSGSIKPWLFAGLLLGLASLTRPIALPIGLGLWLLMLITKTDFLKLKKSLPIAIVPFLVFLPWILVSSNHQSKQQVSNAKSVFALGTYPDLIYKSERYRGFPHREDPNYPKMQKSLAFSITELRNRAEAEPLKYLLWYTFGKPMMLWQWDIIQGAGGANIYPIKRSLYDSADIYKKSYDIIKNTHPILVALAFISCISFLGLALFGSLKSSRTSYPILFLAAVFAYFTLAHTVFAALPRFSIPFQPIMIILALTCLNFGTLRNGHTK